MCLFSMDVMSQVNSSFKTKKDDITIEYIEELEKVRCDTAKMSRRYTSPDVVGLHNQVTR